MPRCAEASCGSWRPERLAPRWAAGIRLNGHWYCSRGCVRMAARSGLDVKAVPPPTTGLRPLRLGVLLRHLNAVSEAELRAALDSQRVTGRRLGAELQARGHTTADQVLRALAAQANVSYLSTFDLRRVTQGPSWLPADTVRVLGLVPFDVDRAGRRLRVICAAPVPRAAIRALQTLSGWATDVFLVADEIWRRALEQYRPATVDEPAAEVITVGGIDAAASLVADAASTERTVTMRHAQWDGFTWIRVEGPTQVSNVLVPDVMEGTCQAAFTAH